jgi:hypothetical protein
MQLAVILPQTLYQIWGLPTHRDLKVFQFEYPLKHIRAHELTTPIYALNSQILELIEITDIKFVKTSEQVELNNFTFDEQLLNLIKYFPNLKISGKKDIIHYTSNPNRVIQISDLIHGLDFLRQLYRNIKYFSNLRPRQIFSVNYPWTNNGSFNHQLLWRNCPIDVQLIQRRSIQFINKYQGTYPELIQLQKHTNPIIICPRYKQKIESFSEWVDLNYDLFEGLNRQIFIKHHRAADEIYPDFFKVRNTNFITLNSPFMRILPLEILLHSFEQLLVITPPSSISAFGERIKLITPFTEVDKKDYGLLHKKLNRDNRLILFN